MGFRSCGSHCPSGREPKATFWGEPQAGFGSLLAFMLDFAVLYSPRCGVAGFRPALRDRASRPERGTQAWSPPLAVVHQAASTPRVGVRILCGTPFQEWP
jgi:hypothetical protein